MYKRQEILSAVGKVDEGDGVAVLTDMFGGTPSNLAMSILGKGKVEVIAGMNLPLLIKLASVRANRPLEEAVIEAREASEALLGQLAEAAREVERGLQTERPEALPLAEIARAANRLVYLRRWESQLREVLLRLGF